MEIYMISLIGIDLPVNSQIFNENSKQKYLFRIFFELMMMMMKSRSSRNIQNLLRLLLDDKNICVEFNEKGLHILMND